MSTQLSRILTPIQFRAPLQLPLYTPAFVSGQIWPATHTPSTDCGALTGNVWKEIVNIAAPGVLQFFALQSGTASSKSFGVRIRMDGEVVAERTLAGNTTQTYHGFSTSPDAMIGSASFIPLTYGCESLSIEVMSTTTLTANSSLRYTLLHYLVK